MKRIVLFSQPTENNKKDILKLLFPSELVDKTFAYMPSAGIRGSDDYIAEWDNIAKDHQARFVAIDNSSNNPEEHTKLLNSDVLLISGGNTFQLLHNLRQSGLDKAITEFSQKQNFVLAGFSAGALVLTPTIKVCSLPGFDENLVGLKDFDSLGIVNFEVFPHYDTQLHKDMLADYRRTANNRVQEISNEDYILTEL